MSPVQNFEQHSRKLVDPDLPIQARLLMAMEVRDSLEIAHTAEYLNFLKCYFRAFSVILLQITKPQFVDNPEHKLRNIVVEILNRLPHSEVLRPFVQDLLKVALQVLTTDNEENALISVRIIFDLLRNFRPTVEAEVQPFLDFVCKIYQNFKATVSHFFESGNVVGEDIKPMVDTSSSDQSLGSSTGYSGSSHLNPSSRSFKIITESPLVVLFLFQLYSRLVQTNIPHLLPLMVAAISVPGPEKVPPHLKNHFIELKGAQVKTVSFLTYLLKSFADYIRPHEESICKSIVNLLVTCSDSVSIRKELLVALKHVLGTDCKRGLFPLIDTLLEERVLVGTGRACFETLRPLAYSLLAEIVHHVRADLSLSQLSRIIYLFSSNMHDASLSLSIHTTCARLMLNLVEPIFEKGVDQPSMDEARVLLDLNSGRMIGSAEQSGGLYYFKDGSKLSGHSQISCFESVSGPNDNEIILWHYRLGHPNFRYLKYLFPKLFINKDLSSFQCKICELAKHHCASYPIQPYKPSKPFSIVHSDIWGPNRVKTISNKQWFITFIDDHTRMSWVYLLKEKSEAEQVFKNFHKMIQTQFQTDI